VKTLKILVVQLTERKNNVEQEVKARSTHTKIRCYYTLMKNYVAIAPCTSKRKKLWCMQILRYRYIVITVLSLTQPQLSLEF